MNDELDKLEQEKDTTTEEHPSEEIAETMVEPDVIEPIEDESLHIEVESNIIKRVWLMVIAGLIYLLIRLFSSNSDETYQFVDFIVIFTSIFGFIGLSIYVYNHQANKDLSKKRLFQSSKIPHRQKKHIYEIVDILTIVPICAVIVTFVFAFIFIFPVSGPSMNPNVQHSENMFAIVSNDVKRFDVVVIQIDPKYYDHNQRERFLKRIIGMPGDTLAHNGTQLFINDQPVDEPFLLDEDGNLKTDIFGGPYQTPAFHFVPSNSNKVCRTIIDDVETICPIVNNVMVIPEGYYFVLGDNRPNSKDSPELGLIREEDIIGIVKYHIYTVFNWKKVE